MDDPRRRAVTALLLIAPVPSIAVLMAVFVAPGPVGRAFWIAGKVVLYGLPVAWLLLVERRRPSLSPARKGGLGTGALLGLAISVLIVAVWLLLGTEWIDRARIRDVAATNGFDTLPVYLAFSAWIVLGNSLLEEYSFRWFIFTRCRALVPSPVAVVLSAAIFTAHHILLLVGYGIAAPVVALGSAGVFLGGLTWSWCYHRYESIWPGYLSHAVVDVAILAIGWRLIAG